jgi:hypothetical protein
MHTNLASKGDCHDLILLCDRQLLIHPDDIEFVAELFVS